MKPHKRALLSIPLLTTLLAAVGMYPFAGWASPPADPDFNAHVAHPAYPSSRHPRVYMDAGHWDEAPYMPFVDLVRNDGYAVETHKGALTRDTLAPWNILVLANALGFRHGAKQIPGLRHNMRGDAFSASECSAIRDWVRDGGSLLLATDYAPTSKSAARLAAMFGITLRDGWAVEPVNHDQVSKRWGFILFSRYDGLLLDHPITRGRNESERLNRVLTFSGQALDYPPDAQVFLKLSPLAREYPYREGSDNSQYSSAAGAAQGVAMDFGKGRVVVLGEAAVLTSQVSSIPGGPVLHYGMGYSGYDDRQLALNVMHWLSRSLN